MLDYAGGQDDAPALFRSLIAEYEIFGEELGKMRPAPGIRHCLAAGGEGGSEGEAHALEHPRYEDAGQELRVHPDGFGG